jgi:deoxyxylulose-5-phosphate synthase
MGFSLSGTLATMACGLPYAIAAKIAYLDRQSVAFVGDGGLTRLGRICYGSTIQITKKSYSNKK